MNDLCGEKIQDAIEFYRSQLHRCKINYRDALKRGDEVAVYNLSHKMDIYSYTIDILHYYLQSVQSTLKSIQESGA